MIAASAKNRLSFTFSSMFAPTVLPAPPRAIGLLELRSSLAEVSDCGRVPRRRFSRFAVIQSQGGDLGNVTLRTTLIQMYSNAAGFHCTQSVRRS
jgi:hypothetical protein